MMQGLPFDLPHREVTTTASSLADNGWKITLGRGLDIFEKVEGRFNVAGIDQTKRKCKACEITYLRI